MGINTAFRIVQAVCLLIISLMCGPFVSALGIYFPDEKDLRGCIKKARQKKNRDTTFLTMLFFSLLSFTGGLFINDAVFAVMVMMLTGALCIIFTVDFRTYEIPFKVNLFIFGLGILRTLLSLEDIWLHIIGFFAVSLPLAIIYYLSKGRAIGFGDVKMMAACGLLLGWKCIVLSLFTGCIVGSVTHLIRMKKQGEGAVLAMGPYLAIGVYISAVWGNTIIDAYLSLIK